MGYGICFIKKQKRLFFCSSFALLSLAAIHHGIFNMLVQSQYQYLGFLLPTVTYAVIIVQRWYNNRKIKE